MFSRHLLFTIVIALAGTSAVRAQAVNLTEAPLDKRCVKNELTMELDGKIKIKQDGKDLAFPHKANAKHVFVERFLEAGPSTATKAARFYTTAESTITFNNNDSSKRTLREKLRFLVTQRTKDALITFSPGEIMTREEMELTEHFDTMAVSGLVPGKMVEVGRKWNLPNGVVAALCELDGLTLQDIEAKLESVKDNVAHVTLVGKVQGINLGAQVGMIVNGRYEFDLKEQRLTFLEWKEADERQQGPITPALSADVTIKLMRKAVAVPDELGDLVLPKVPDAKTPPSELTKIRHDDAKKQYTLHYGRDWHVVSPEDSPQLVLRHLERGEFIAQATLTSYKKADPKNVMTIDAFAKLMAETPGWQQKEETERTEFKAADLAKGHHAVYRVVASGDLDGVRTTQIFYLVVNPQGEQRIVTFSVVPQHAERFGARDVELIRELAIR